MSWELSTSGALVGILVGMTGVGGGALMTPLLVLMFGVHPATAVGTDLLFAAVTKSVGTACQGFTQNINWRIVWLLAAGSVPMTILTILILHYVRSDVSSYNRVISLLLAAVLAITAVTILFHNSIISAFGDRYETGPPESTVAVLTVLIGGVLGVVVTTTSIGAGAIGMTALTFLYPRLPPSRLVAADVAHAVPLTLFAGFGHWHLGLINWQMLSFLLIGSVPGVVVGSYLSWRAPVRVLRIILAGVLLLVAQRLVAA